MHILEHLLACFRLARYTSFNKETAIVLIAWTTLNPQIKAILGTPLISKA